MIFRQLFDTTSSTYTYLLGDQASGRAVLIDPVLELADRDLEQIHDLGLTLSHVLDTHVHADHVTAASVLKSRTGATTVSSERGAVCADRKLKHGEPLQVGGITIRALATPGHTDDSLSYVLNDRVFTGDALLVRGCGRTDFQNGDPETLYKSITEVLFALPDTTQVFPAHDYKGLTVTTIGEERRFNPRLAGKSMAEFAAIMRGLNLPPPKLIDKAVPANRLCGNVPMG
ncbi:MAG: MBL fold metallo-hydrolase [Myxococcota bacterium]|nr:MBL fold metallo-hydrolase [Myxococcota bacterium]